MNQDPKDAVAASGYETLKGGSIPGKPGGKNEYVSPTRTEPGRPVVAHAAPRLQAQTSAEIQAQRVKRLEQDLAAAQRDRRNDLILLANAAGLDPAGFESLPVAELFERLEKDLRGLVERAEIARKSRAKK